MTPQNRSIILVALLIMLTGNVTLFKRLLELYPLGSGHGLFLGSLVLSFTITTVMFLLLICHGRFARWVLAGYVFIASQAAYYMDQYGVVIDAGMLDNMLQTTPQEFLGLISYSLVFRTLLLGVVPAYVVLKYSPQMQNWWTELKSRVLLLGVLLLALVLVVAPFFENYSSFIRGHKMTRFYANPTFLTYSAFVYLKQRLQSSEVIVPAKTAEDAREVESHAKHELIVLVVGETARADRFSLNGYAKETNPELKKQQVVSFRDVASCGTATRVSVPCMFSVLKRSGFDNDKALHIENALDVLARSGVQILWRDNNSDSKGVATRMQYESFRSPAVNPVCDDECRDIGMLSGLDRFVSDRKGKDILIVLHQMGNHGPEYFRRYPKEFERFTPACKSNELSDCGKEEIDNAYDNAILYTDFFLAHVIEFLKGYENEYETAMLYVSDHGESLGEHGIYLHAMPYAVAPVEQTHIPVVMWVGKGFDYGLDQIRPFQDYPLSHDDLFCMLMVGYEIDTKTCVGRKGVFMENLDFKSGVKH